MVVLTEVIGIVVQSSHCTHSPESLSNIKPLLHTQVAGGIKNFSESNSMP